MAAACIGRSLLFDDEERTDEARAICKRECPEIIECRAWALRTDVAGVCGGLTETEREQWRIENNVQLPTDRTLAEINRQVATKLRRVKVADMRERGVAAPAIARALDIDVRLVHKDISRLGMGVAPAPLDDAQIAELIASGLPKCRVAAIVGVTSKTIYQALRRHAASTEQVSA